MRTIIDNDLIEPHIIRSVRTYQPLWTKRFHNNSEKDFYIFKRNNNWDNVLQAICLQICEDIDEEKCLSIDVQTCETVTNDVRRQIIKIFILIILVIIKIMTIVWYLMTMPSSQLSGVHKCDRNPLQPNFENHRRVHLWRQVGAISFLVLRIAWWLWYNGE